MAPSRLKSKWIRARRKLNCASPRAPGHPASWWAANEIGRTLWPVKFRECAHPPFKKPAKPNSPIADPDFYITLLGGLQVDNTEAVLRRSPEKFEMAAVYRD
jgi:hypothetical protein